MSYKAGLAGWATPAGRGFRFTVGPLGEKAHLGQLCHEEGRGCTFTEKAGADTLSAKGITASLDFNRSSQLKENRAHSENTFPSLNNEK